MAREFFGAADDDNFIDDDLEDEDNPYGDVRVQRRRIRPIAVDIDGFRNLEDKTFKEHFRMNRHLFELLLVALGNHLRDHGRLIRLRTPLDLILMMSLWVLGTQDTFRSVAVKFSIGSRGTVHYHFVTVVEALREMAPRFIQWPNEFERDNIKRHYERKYNYPGVVGCIDGSHVYISAPLLQGQRYVNRFKKHSILVQAVCDHKLIFRDVYVGQPGSVHDSRMFQRSPLSHNLLHNEQMLSHGEHLLGDGAYTLTDKVITPYRDNGHLTRRQRRHNYIHASTRSSIERAFARFKEKWRRLKLMLVYALPICLDTIVSSCMLHNFILLEGRPYDNALHNGMNLVPVVPAEIENAEDDNVPIVPERDPAIAPAKRAGRRKREFIAHLLHPDD